MTLMVQHFMNPVEHATALSTKKCSSCGGDIRSHVTFKQFMSSECGESGFCD